MADNEHRAFWESARGECPEHWEFHTIENLLEHSKSISVGVMYPGGDSTSGVPLIRVTDVKNGFVVARPSFCVSLEVDEEYKRTRLNGTELLITLVGNPGDCVVVQPEMAGWNVARALAVVRLADIELRQWIRHILLSPPAKHLIDVRLNTTVQKTLNLKDIRLLGIPVPPKSERDSITRVISALDDKIELNRRMNGTLEGMAQALFKSWFVDFDPVIDNALAAGNPIPAELANRAEVRRAALADGTANREAAKPFPAAFQQTEELGWIPVGWEVSKLIEQVLLIMGQSPPSTFYNNEGNGLPFHQGVTNYGERFPTHVQFSTAGNRYAEKGDILFSVRAPVGRINISDRKIIVGRGLSAIRHKRNLQAFLVYFLKHTFQKEDSIGSGTIFNAVNKKEMENIPFLKPTDNHAAQFNDIAQGFDQKIAVTACESEALTKLRDTLLPKLISGELRIPEAEKLAEAALA